MHSSRVLNSSQLWRVTVCLHSEWKDRPSGVSHNTSESNVPPTTFHLRGQNPYTWLEEKGLTLSFGAPKRGFLMADAWRPVSGDGYMHSRDREQGQETQLNCARCQRGGGSARSVLGSAGKWKVDQSRLVDWSLSTFFF